MTTTRLLSAGVLAGCLAIFGCQNLDISNPNAPTLDQTLSDPINLETTAGSSFKYLWAMMQNDDPRQGTNLYPGIAIGGLADEITSPANTNQFNDVAGRPRGVYDNTQAGAWVTREPMANYYTAVNGCADVIRSINFKGVKLGLVSAAFPQGRHTQRAKWFCNSSRASARSTSASSTTRRCSCTTRCRPKM